MAKNTSPKRVPQRPLGPPDGPQQQPPDMSDPRWSGARPAPPLCVSPHAAEYDAAHEDHTD